MKNKLIYLDNAATTFPKPQGVLRAVDKCLRDFCGNPSRGSNPLAMKSAETVFDCRQLLSETFSCPVENVIFTYNTTYALNMALKGCISNGCHVLTSNMEHNATYRTLEKLKSSGVIEYDTFATYGHSASEILEDIERKVTPKTKVLCCIHASNICSYTLPITAIGNYCRDRGIIFICDGAQSAGHMPLDMKKSSIDILCLPYHKGLYGPQGGGIMLLREGLCIDTLIEGGNGYSSLDPTMGDISPERYEAGTLNTPAAAGLCEGLRFVRERTPAGIQRQDCILATQALSMLSSIPRVELYDNTPGSVILFNIRGMSADEAGEIFSRQNICLRSGFHCAPLAHSTLGTPEGGALRISFGAFNTPMHIQALACVAEDISTGKLSL